MSGVRELAAGSGRAKAKMWLAVRASMTAAAVVTVGMIAAVTGYAPFGYHRQVAGPQAPHC